SSKVKLIKLFGICNLCIARRSIRGSMESKALEISCCKTNSGLLCSLASCKIDSNRFKGISQEQPGSPAKLSPKSTENCTKKAERRLYIMRVINFRAESRRVIGLVFFK